MTMTIHGQTVALLDQETINILYARCLEFDVENRRLLAAETVAINEMLRLGIELRHARNNERQLKATVEELQHAIQQMAHPSYLHLVSA